MSHTYSLFINIKYINVQIQYNCTVYIVYRGNPILFLIDKNIASSILDLLGQCL